MSTNQTYTEHCRLNCKKLMSNAPVLQCSVLLFSVICWPSVVGCHVLQRHVLRLSTGLLITQNGFRCKNVV